MNYYKNIDIESQNLLEKHINFLLDRIEEMIDLYVLILENSKHIDNETTDIYLDLIKKLYDLYSDIQINLWCLSDGTILHDINIKEIKNILGE